MTTQSGYVARWTTAEERRQYHTWANGVVEDFAHNVVCFVSPLNMAKRIAFALNLSERFSLEELERISGAIKR